MIAPVVPPTPHVKPSVPELLMVTSKAAPTGRPPSAVSYVQMATGWHMPATHVPFPQEWAHAPQLFGSVWSATHEGEEVVPQLISSLGQRHWPDWHVSPPEHVWPPAQPAVLAPQKVSFVCGSMQVPLVLPVKTQKASPDAHWHEPVWHVWPPLHVV